MSKPFDFVRAMRFEARVAWSVAITIGIGLVVSFRGFARAHDRVDCGINVRQLGIAIGSYASEHGGAMPNELAALIESGDLTNGIFVCPATDLTWSPATRATDLRADFAAGRHCSYFYVRDASRLAADVVAFEPLANHVDGANVLVGDGRVEFVPTVVVTSIQKQFDAHVRPIVAR